MHDLQQQRQEQGHRGLRHSVQRENPQCQTNRRAERQSAPREKIVGGPPIQPEGQADEHYRCRNQEEALR